MSARFLLTTIVLASLAVSSCASAPAPLPDWAASPSAIRTVYAEDYGTGEGGVTSKGSPPAESALYDAAGYDRDGYDRSGFNKEGYHKNGTLYDDEGYDKDGYWTSKCPPLYDAAEYDRDGYDKDGYGREGFNRAGYDRRGFNKEGYHRNGTRYDEDGFEWVYTQRR
jgi:hypothetical protein